MVFRYHALSRADLLKTIAFLQVLPSSEESSMAKADLDEKNRLAALKSGNPAVASEATFDRPALSGPPAKFMPAAIRNQSRGKMRLSLDMLLSNLPGMVYRCLNDELWTMEFVSAGSEDLTGYRPEDLIRGQ